MNIAWIYLTHMLWFNVIGILGLTFFVFVLGIVMYDNESKTKENKIIPRIKLNHSICIRYSYQDKHKINTTTAFFMQCLSCIYHNFPSWLSLHYKLKSFIRLKKREKNNNCLCSFLTRSIHARDHNLLLTLPA